MNDIERINRQINVINNPLSLNTRHRRSQRQRISPSAEPQTIATINQLLPPELSQTSQLFSMPDTKSKQIISTTSLTSPITSSNSLLDHSNMTTNHLQTPNFVAQQKLGLSDSLNNTSEDNDVNLSRKKNLSTSDLDPLERRKRIALAKAEAKLEKAQHLYRTARQSVEHNLSEFLRITTIPNVNNESNTTNTAYETRIQTLQQAVKELEKKIVNYQSDIARIQVGDIPDRYTSSTGTLNNNIKNQVSNDNSEHNSTNEIPTSMTNEQPTLSHHVETDNHPIQSNVPSTSINHTQGTGNNNQNLLSLSQNSNNTLEPVRSSPSSSISNEIGNSQFYHAFNYDTSIIHDTDKSPLSKRRLTDDSNVEFTDRISDQSSDDRFVSYNTSKRNTMTTIECQQLILKIDSIQKVMDRSEMKMNELQKQIDLVRISNESQYEQYGRLNTDLSDLTHLYHHELPPIKNELIKLEEKLLYNFNEYWTEMVEKFDKLETRTTKVEQTQAHSFETEENTHRVISKFVNILLTVFAIILLLLSTIKNLLQSRVHAVILLILVFTWITFHYLPENSFQSPFSQNFTNIFKRTS